MNVTKVTVALLNFANPPNKTLKCIVWAGRGIFGLLNPLSHEVTTRLYVQGYVNIDNIWRIRNNMETDKLIEGADTVRFINP